LEPRVGKFATGGALGQARGERPTYGIVPARLQVAGRLPGSQEPGILIGPRVLARPQAAGDLSEPLTTTVIAGAISAYVRGSQGPEGSEQGGGMRR
jgi:hypothetical protein